MKKVVNTAIGLFFIAGLMLTNVSIAESVPTCEVKTMCTVACGAGYVKCSGQKCKKGSTWVECDGSRTNCCAAT